MMATPFLPREALVEASGVYSLVAICGLLIAVASLVADLRLWGLQAQPLGCTGSRVQVSSCGAWA